MGFRQNIDEDGEGLNIYSGDDDEGEGEPHDLFEEGQLCDLCGSAEGRIGIDPTCRGSYDGNPVFACFGCAPAALKDAFSGVQGISVIVEPFDDYDTIYYYRVDEMPAYSFIRDDIEAVSWLLLTVGDDCARCGEQSRHAWLTRDFIDPRLPEGEPVFRDTDRDCEHLCNGCAAAALAEACASMKLPLMTVEVPRSAMGLVIPAGD